MEWLGRVVQLRAVTRRGGPPREPSPLNRTWLMSAAKANTRSSYTSALPVDSKPSVSMNSSCGGGWGGCKEAGASHQRERGMQRASAGRPAAAGATGTHALPAASSPGAAAHPARARTFVTSPPGSVTGRGSPHSHTPLVWVSRVCPTPKPTSQPTPISWFRVKLCEVLGNGQAGWAVWGMDERQDRPQACWRAAA